MCIDPIKLDGVTVGCRKCWQCRSVKVDNCVGRALCEQATASSTDVITLTYGRGVDGEEFTRDSTLLNGRHPTAFWKALRDAGYEFSYMCAGEYGSKKGRAHWHAIIFWRGDKKPQIEYGQRVHSKQWPHGHVFWDYASESSMRYVAKYVAKDGNKLQSRFSYSKRPALGDEYMKRLGKRYAEQRIVPRDRIYRFSGVTTSDGRHRRFRMTDTMLDTMLTEFEKTWSNLYGKLDYYGTDLTDQWADRKAEGTFDPGATIVSRPYRSPVKMKKPKWPPRGGGKIYWDAHRLHWCCHVNVNQVTVKVYYTQNGQGGWQWQHRELEGVGVQQGGLNASFAEMRHERELQHDHALEMQGRFSSSRLVKEQSP